MAEENINKEEIEKKIKEKAESFAQRAEKAGEQIGNKFGEEKEKHKGKIGRAGRIFGYIITIIFNLIFLYIFNNFLNWNINFVTEKLNDSLFYINLSLVAGIVANFLLIFYDEKLFKNGLEMITNIFSFIAAYYIFINYPFDFSKVSDFNFDLLIKICLVVAMVGIGIAVFVNLAKLLKSIKK